MLNWVAVISTLKPPLATAVATSYFQEVCAAGGFHG